MNYALKDKGQYISDDIEIIGIFKTLIQSKEKIWVWQRNISKVTGNRPVHMAIIKKVDPMKKIIEIRPTNQSGFRFDPEEEIFLYSTSRFIAVKINVKTRTSGIITFSLPERLNILDKNFLHTVGVLENEQEDKYKHLREGPRKAAKGNQIVTIKRISNNAIQSHFLHDMSGGGMGFMIEDPGEYQVGEKIEIENIDGKPLSKTVTGTIVAIRQLDNKEFGQFKIGIKFD